MAWPRIETRVLRGRANQAQRLIDANRDVLLDRREFCIDTDELCRGLRSSWQRGCATQAVFPRSPSIVETGSQLEAVALHLVVIDPELRSLFRQDVGYALHRGQRLVFTGVARRHAAIFPVAPEVDGIAREHYRACVRQFHQ